MRVPTIVVGLLICAGCRPEPVSEPPLTSTGRESPSPIESEPEAATPRIEPPACAVEVDLEQDTVLVAGQPSPIDFVGYGDRWVVYPAGPGEILVAMGYEHAWGVDRSDTGATLWRVRCADPANPEPVLELEGAEFTRSVLSHDGEHIYFSYRGVHSYAIATGKIERRLEPRRIPECWEYGDENGVVDSEEFVLGWLSRDVLIVASGGPCGFESEWEGEVHLITDFHDANEPAKRRPRSWVGPLAVGAGGRSWVGDGGECLLGYARNQLGSPGVWRSDDVGTTWTFLPLPSGQAGVVNLWPSPGDPDRVVVATECCGHDGDGECEPSGGGQRFLTLDGGKTWKPTKESLDAPANPRAAIQIGDFVLEPTEDGLERRGLNAAFGTGEIVLRPDPKSTK